MMPGDMPSLRAVLNLLGTVEHLLENMNPTAEGDEQRRLEALESLRTATDKVRTVLGRPDWSEFAGR